SLFGRELASHFNLALNSIDLSFSGFALGTIGRINLRMGQQNCYLFQWPTFSPGVKRDCHRRATAERGQEHIVRRGPRVSSTRRNRFVTSETMRTNLNLLRKAGRVAANNYMRQIVGPIVPHL